MFRDTRVQEHTYDIVKYMTLWLCIHIRLYCINRTGYTWPMLMECYLPVGPPTVLFIRTSLRNSSMFSERNRSERFWFHVYPLLLLLLRWIKSMAKRRNTFLCSYIAWTYLVLQTSFPCVRANNGEGERKAAGCTALVHSHNGRSICAHRFSKSECCKRKFLHVGLVWRSVNVKRILPRLN